MSYEGSSFYDDANVFDTYSKHRERADSANNTLERPVIIELLGDVRHQDFLDLGCGNAEFGKELLAAGAASYVGVDGSQNMITQATITLQATKGRVVRSQLQDWTFPAASCSRVCSRLALHYLPDLEPLFRKIHAALRPDGLFVFSVEHPAITSRIMPQLEGLRQDWIVDDYFKTGKRVTDWMGASVVKYHRTIEDHFATLRACGFQVASIREAKPIRENFKSDETFFRRQRIPLFLCMAARKARTDQAE